ncbi:MAG: saccharopine dehydrogenase NADP-binding domain-containing protein, partial [Akkermansia sp.]
MNKVLIIGAGGVGHVVAHKCAQMSDVYHEIHLASRTKSKCDAIAADVLAREGVRITTHALDADDVPATVALLRELKPDLLLNVALPYQ